MMRATFVVDTQNADRLKESQRLFKLLFYIADRVTQLRLSQSSRAKTDKNRREAEKHKQREKNEEQEEEKLKEKKEKEKAYYEKLKTLPPEQQRKLEEKKRSKDMLK